MWYDSYFLFGLTKCTSRKKLSQHKNNQVFINSFMRLMDIAAASYSQRLNVEVDSVNKRLLIQSLIAYGAAVFFRETEGAPVICLAGLPGGGGFNIYGDPLTAQTFSRNGLMNKEIPLYIPGSEDTPVLNDSTTGRSRGQNKGFLLWDNKNRFPFINYVVYYAEAIADTLRTIDVARKWYKMPSLPVCEQSLVDSVTQVFRQIDDNDDIIPVSTGIREIEKFDLKPVGDVTKNITSATALVDWYEQQFRALCGFKSNAAIDKKGENLLQDEVNINSEVSESLDDVKWDYIGEQTDAMNAYFGEDIITLTEPDPMFDSASAGLTDDHGNAATMIYAGGGQED